MENSLNNLKLEDNTDINILLLGETGVGKSTFINSIANYLHYHELKEALNQPLFFLIPCMFNITDENFKIHRVVVGSDNNELQLVGDSATQDVKTYVFPIGNGKTRLRLIDTPGMGDPRGVDQDDINCENILSYIGQLNHLHAICFLFKPNDARITVMFEYCVKQILSRLEKSAAKNIIFLFTNCKGTNYRPGETIACLKKVVDEIKSQPPFVDIKVEDNYFCFDNEAFRYLAAVKKGVEFDKDFEEQYLKSWETSSEEGRKLIRYIIGDIGHSALTPHLVKATTSINEARRIIIQLAQPLADISQLILDNLRILDRREQELLQRNQSLDDMRSKLYVPIINLRVINLTQPATVCCDEKCAEFLPVDGLNTWNYKQRCHDPCYLRNVPQEIVGAPQLKDCTAMNKATQTCLKCGCAQTVHMHIYYMTEKFDDKKVDPNIQSKINTAEKAQTEAERVIRDIKQRKTELEDEKDVIIDVCAKFAHFLQKNAITPFNDAYKKYLEYMLFREKGLGKHADPQNIHHLEKLLSRYDQMKSTFDEVVKLSANLDNLSVNVDSKDICKQLEKLYSLKHNGKQIKHLYNSQKLSRRKEYGKSEYVHASPVLHPKNHSERQTKSNIEECDKNKCLTKTYHKNKNANDKKKNNFKHNGIQNFENKFKKNRTDSSNLTKSIITSTTNQNEQIKIEIIRGSKARSNQPNKNIGRPNLKVTQESGSSHADIRQTHPGRLPYESRQPHDSRPLHDGKPFNDVRKPHDNPPPYNSRSSFYANRQPHYEGNPPYDRPPYFNRPPNDNVPPYDNRATYDYRPPYDNRPLQDERPPYDNRPAHDYRPPYDNRPLQDNRTLQDNRPPYNTPSPYDNRSPYDYRYPYDYRSAHENRPPQDSQLPYDIRPSNDNRRPYDNRSYDNRPTYDYRSNDNRPTYDNRPYDSRTPHNAYNDHSFREMRHGPFDVVGYGSQAPPLLVNPPPAYDHICSDKGPKKVDSTVGKPKKGSRSSSRPRFKRGSGNCSSCNDTD